MPRVQALIVIALLLAIVATTAIAFGVGAEVPRLLVTEIEGDESVVAAPDAEDRTRATDALGDRRAVEAASPDEIHAVTGHVVDASGRAIRGATIREPAFGAEAAHAAAACVSDHEGTFRYMPSAAGQLRIEVAADGFVTEVRQLRGRDEPFDAGQIVLIRGPEGRGMVTDAAGVPIGDVEFAMRSVAARDRQVLRVRADAGGRFVTPRLAPGTHQVTFAAPFDRRFEVTIPTDADAVAFDFSVPRPGAALRGVVVDDRGDPIGGAQVRIRGWKPPRREATTSTAPTGRFALFTSAPFAGGVELAAAADGHDPALLSFVDDGRSERRVVLRRGFRFAIDVRDEAGVPIERYGVDLYAASGGRPLAPRSSRRTHPGGRFGLTLPRGEYLCVIRPHGRALVPTEVFAVDLTERDWSGVVVPEPGREVEFRNHLSDTTTVKKATLIVHADPTVEPKFREPIPYLTATILDGHVRVRLPERRLLRLRVEGAFPAYERDRFVVTQPRESIVVPNGAVVVGQFEPRTSGRVLLTNVADERVIWPPEKSQARWMFVDELGRFRMHGVPDGDWDVRLHPSLWPAPEPMKVGRRLLSLRSGETRHVVCDGNVGVPAIVVAMPRVDGQLHPRELVDVHAISSEATGAVTVWTRRLMTSFDGKLRYRGPSTRLVLELEVDVTDAEGRRIGPLRTAARPNLIPADRSLQFTDVTTAPLTIHLVDEQGAPVAGRVLALSTGIGNAPPLLLPRTDVHGRITVRGVPVGMLDILDAGAGRGPRALGQVWHDVAALEHRVKLEP